jgi:hypothetical protein
MPTRILLASADRPRMFDAGRRSMAPLEIGKYTSGQDANQAPRPTIPVNASVTWTYVTINLSPFNPPVKR